MNKRKLIGIAAVVAVVLAADVSDEVSSPPGVREILGDGVFGGAYFRQYPKLKREFPDFEYVRSETEVADNNFYGVNASMSRHEWVIRGWMHLDDPRGWFQWWCRYELGRRHEDDDRQIGRWLVFKARKLREIGDNTDQSKHVRTRQGLLHWGIKSPGMGIY